MHALATLANTCSYNYTNTFTDVEGGQINGTRLSEQEMMLPLIILII